MVYKTKKNTSDLKILPSSLAFTGPRMLQNQIDFLRACCITRPYDHFESTNFTMFFLSLSEKDKL